MTTKSTFNVRFVAQKGKLNSAGKAPIFARINVNGEVKHFFTKFHILPDRWDSKEGRALGRTGEEREINQMLEDYRSLIKTRYNEIVLLGDVVTVDKVRQAALGLDHQSKKLLDICDKFIEEYLELVVSGSVTLCTYQRYVLTRSRLAGYMKSKRKIDDILVSEINNDFIKGFDLWNRTWHGAANNTAARFVKHFRTMFNMALNNGWVRTDPFATYKIKLERVDRGYLTQQELETIMNKQLVSKRLELVRDVFIFSSYTGLAYIDVKELTTDKIQMRDGKQWIITKRHKTDINSNIMLLDVPLQIIEKYKGQAKGNRVLPVMSNQKINDYLKEIAAVCGIEKPLSFHLARHTFATTVTLSNGVPIETVSRMLGHTSVKTTQIYARIVDKKIEQDMTALANKLNGAPAQAAGM